ncbi:MAG TPA: alternative ribosome rescue aminoacyl-tRNA hydrolase ArfB [Dermatophilaceae bacterium]
MAANNYEPGGDLVLGPGPGFRSGFVLPAAELLERFSRSSGPGGQGVNTTDSRVELRWQVLESPALARLSEAQRLRVESAFQDRLVAGALIIVASEHRSQRQNRVAARNRLAEALRQALLPPPPARRATQPTRGSQRRRLEAKRQRGATKSGRGQVRDEDA